MLSGTFLAHTTLNNGTRAINFTSYIRVSTQRQAQANGLAQQLERLQAHALQQGWSVAAEDIFRDDGYSGARLKRAAPVSNGRAWSGCEIGRRCVNWIAS